MQSQVWGKYLTESWVGRCGLAAQSLTLFKRRISDFPTLFKTECQFLIPRLRHLLWHNQTEIKRGVNSYILILIKTLVHLKIPCLRQTVLSERDTPFKTKNPENHTMPGCPFPLSPYNGVPPPPRVCSLGVAAIENSSSRMTYDTACRLDYQPLFGE